MRNHDISREQNNCKRANCEGGHPHQVQVKHYLSDEFNTQLVAHPSCLGSISLLFIISPKLSLKHCHSRSVYSAVQGGQN